MIFTVQGVDFIIDEEDYHIAEKYPWRINRQGYLRCNHSKGGELSELLFHRVIMGVNDPKILVDHRDRNPRNNKKSNLRLTDYLGNSRNVSKWSKPTSSKYKGVSVTSDGMYLVSIRTGTEEAGRIRERYDNEDVAGYVYNLYAIKYFGEYASLNNAPTFTSAEIEKSKLSRNSNEKVSSHKGVSWRKGKNKWLAQFYHNKKRYRVGQFDTEEEAYQALIEKKREMGIL
ncbi:AP2/ERF family transcription factor [Priestia megaterium]|uniref:AP2/ERF family transcription factor n=1 Tax=Priestia megaterium TaxID=1404 RepID=UPI002E1C75BE|nr:AP2/ERF family transcription factor [Priestia megaterium]